ncbi:hypothetical protein RBH88_03260 [Aminobacterium sp. MB27-C1]|uniref:hypothetical protein n=1 Tax=Aminobacterium sp. MB27-C1 TaxID=3070661 RepID=UPI0027DB2B2D|nr:hypothetical protein [Aminobacterium sp. MB27-C1]WMI72132.1 hypothetical protein RBH88_03260 [Aminobacterium sp. MB27-C1]
MGKVYELAVHLDSKISSSLGKSFISTAANIERLDKRLQGLNDRLGKINAFRKLKKDTHDTRLQFILARSDAKLLSREMVKSEKPARTLQNRFGSAQKKVESLQVKLIDQRKELVQLEGALLTAGISTKSFKSEQEQITKQIDKTTKIQKKLQAIQGKKQANQQKRSQLRERVADIEVLDSLIAAPVNAAKKAQNAEIKLPTAVNEKHNDSAMNEALSVMSKYNVSPEERGGGEGGNASQNSASLSASIGKMLLPGVNNVASLEAKSAEFLTEMTEKFPFLTNALSTTAVAWVKLNKAATIGSYVWTFVQDGALGISAVFTNVRASILLLRGGHEALMASQLKGTAVAKAVTFAQKGWQKALNIGRTTKHIAMLGIMKVKTVALAMAQKAAAAAQWLFNAALSASPIAIAVIAVSGLIAAGIALYKNWDKVSSWFSGFWNTMKAGFGALASCMVEPFRSVFEWLAEKIEWFKEKWNGLKKFIGFGGDEESQKEEADLAWDVYSSVPGYASGAIARSPHLAVVAEEGGESIIPHAPHRRKRAINLWEKTGDILGVNNSEGSIDLTFAPNITVSGNGNATGDLEMVMKKACDDLMRRIESMRRDERRLNFS